MSIEKVREYLKTWNRDKDILEMPVSTATVAEAAAALGTEPARIAKSISLKRPEPAPVLENVSRETGRVIIVVAAGDMKLDNRKFKDCFGFKAKMLSPEEALNYTGHAVGGVCPFGLPPDVDVYLDVSIKRFTTIFPACGSANSAIELTPEELDTYSRSKNWVDVCAQFVQGQNTRFP